MKKVNILVVDDDQLVLDPTGILSPNIHSGSGKGYPLPETAAHH